MGVKAATRCLADHGPQHGMFCRKPRHCLGVRAKLFRYCPALTRFEYEGPGCLIDQEHSAISCVQVVVECSVDGGAALGQAVVSVSSFCGVGAEQIVEGEPARDVLS